MSNEARPSMSANGIHAAGGYGPPGGGYGGPPPGGGAPPGGDGYGGGAPPGGGGYGGGAPPGGGGYGGGAPPGGGGYGGPPQGGGFGGPPQGGGFGGGGPGFGPPGGFPPPGGPMMPGAGGDVNTTLPLILNIVAAVLCGAGCLTFIFSIIGIVFAVQGGNAKNAGDLVTAKAKAKTSTLMFIITAVLGVIGTIIAIVLRVING